MFTLRQLVEKKKRKSGSKAAETSQEATMSILEEEETEEREKGQRQGDKITRGSSIGSPLNKKEMKPEEINNEEHKDTWQQTEARRRTDEK